MAKEYKTIGDFVKDPNHPIVQAVRNAEASFAAKDRSFDCISCAKNFTPQKDQWIFHNLCNECFAEFDSQKMSGRMSFLTGGIKVTYTESVSEWIASKPGRGST